MLVLSRKNLESLFIKVPGLDVDELLERLSVACQCTAVQRTALAKELQSIKHGEEVIKVQVVGTGKLVRLGIEADRKVTVLRQELLEKADQAAAAK